MKNHASKAINKIACTLRATRRRILHVAVFAAYLSYLMTAPFVGLQTASAAFFSDEAITSFPTLGSSQTIYASIESNDGSLYVGGLFDTIGGVPRNNIARILSNGTIDALFNPDIDGEVRSLKLDIGSNTLYVGGSFSTVNGATSRDNIAAFDSLTGSVKPLNVATSGAVYALELNSDASTLYVGGSFNDTYDDYASSIRAVAVDGSGNKYILDVTNNQVVKLDSNNNLVTQWGIDGSGDGEFDGPTDIALDSAGNVYVTDEGNGRIQKFASDGSYITQWGVFGSGDGEFSEISSIAVDSSDDIYVADPDNIRIQKFDSDGNYITQWGSAGSGDGEFSNLRSVSADLSGNVYVLEGLVGNNRIQKFTNTGVYITEWELPLANNYDITTNAAGNVYLATDYATINYYSPVGADLGSWEVADGSINSMALAGNGGSDIYVAAVNDNYIEQYSTQVGYEGELLSSIYGMKERQDLVAFSTANGAVASFNADIEPCGGGGTVHKLVYDGSTNSMYIGGHISRVKNVSRNGMAKVDSQTGQLDSDFNPDISWIDGTSNICSEVYDLVLHENTVYAAGNFDKVNGATVARNNFAAFESTEGAVDENFNPNVRGTVYAIAYDGSGVIYAGGSFTKANGSISRSGLTSFRVSDGRVTLFNPNMQTPNAVYSLAVARNGSKLFAGGSFSYVGGLQRRGFAAFGQTECTYVNFSAPAPSEGTSVPLFSQSIGAQKSDGQFMRYYSPDDMAVDSASNVYVIDQEQENGGAVSQILKYSSSGVFISKFGSLGSGSGQFNSPYGVAVDSADNVYVADTGNNRIQKFDSTGTYLDQWGSLGSGSGQFNSPYGVAVDSADNVYVADTGNNRIQKFDSTGTYLDQWGSAGSGSGQFNSPNALVADENDDIFVSDRYNYRIQKFTNTGSFDSIINTGASAYAIDVNSSGTLYVLTGGGLMVYDSNGVYVETLGDVYVESVAVDRSNDSIYVGDKVNTRIRKLSITYDNLLEWGVPAYGDNNQLAQPRSGNYAIGSDGKIYVQLNSGVTPEIKIYAPNGDFLDKWSGSDYYAGGMAVDEDGYVYTTYWNSVRKFDDTGTMVQEIFVNTNGNLNNPQSIVIDDVNDLMYVADTANSRVVSISLSGSVHDMEYGMTSVEALALSPTGETLYILGTNVREYTANGLNFVVQWGTSGSGAGQLSSPRGISTDSVGNIYIADAGNNRIQKYNSDGDYLSQWGQDGTNNGQFRYYDDNPRLGVDVDNLDNVWVADTYNNRIQKFSYIPNDSDFDDDGTPDSEELESINDGDGNDDCELDAEQENVSSLLNDQLGGYITIVGPNGSRFVSSATLTAPNTNDQYPFGLFSFVLDDVAVGSAVEINAYIDEDKDPAGLVAKKYFPSTQTYINIPDATITPVSINGQNVLRITYRINDGSIFDLDGLANGNITDTAGMAVLGTSTVSTPRSPVSQLLQNTGSNIFGRLLFSVSVITLVYLVSKRKVSSKSASRIQLERKLGSFLVQK